MYTSSDNIYIMLKMTENKSNKDQKNKYDSYIESEQYNMFKRSLNKKIGV